MKLFKDVQRIQVYMGDFVHQDVYVQVNMNVKMEHAGLFIL